MKLNKLKVSIWLIARSDVSFNIKNAASETHVCSSTLKNVVAQLASLLMHRSVSVLGPTDAEVYIKPL